MRYVPEILQQKMGLVWACPFGGTWCTCPVIKWAPDCTTCADHGTLTNGVDLSLRGSKPNFIEH